MFKLWRFHVPTPPPSDGPPSLYFRQRLVSRLYGPSENSSASPSFHQTGIPLQHNYHRHGWITEPSDLPLPTRSTSRRITNITHTYTTEGENKSYGLQLLIRLLHPGLPVAGTL